MFHFNEQRDPSIASAPVKSRQLTRGLMGKPLTVFGLGEDRAVLRTAVQNHTRSEQVRAALELDAGFPAELGDAVSGANHLHSGSVALPLVPGV